MARAPEQAVCPAVPNLLLFVLVVLVRGVALAVVCGDPEASALVIPGGGQTKAMFLPLVLRAANSTRQWAAEGGYYGQRRQRQLQRAGDQKQSTARMRLYDDLLTNGYYTTRLWIGTPPQEFALIVDSGSTVTYVPCSTCEQCGNHQDPRFQPDLSNTYQPVKCNIDCTCDNEKNQCTYERQYAERSSSSGVLGEDLMSFGKESALEPQRAVFGCENVETGDLFSQHADGIMGLGRGQLSIMDQLVDKGVISDSFSLCYGGMDVGGGAMVLGGISPPPEMIFSHSDPVRSPYYNIELKEIRISGKPLQLNPRVFDSKHGTVLDSGTTYAYLPEAAFVAFRDAIHTKKRNRLEQKKLNDLVFVQYNQRLRDRFLRFQQTDFDLICLKDINDYNEWICHPPEDEDFVHEDDDLKWLEVEITAGIDEEEGPNTRLATKKHCLTKKKGITSSFQLESIDEVEIDSDKTTEGELPNEEDDDSESDE